MKADQLKHAEEKLQFLLHAQINCHPSMKAYYQGEYIKQKQHVGTLK